MRFITNEKKYAEEILISNNLGDNVWYTLSVLAKFFYSQGMIKRNIKIKLNELISERLPMAVPEMYGKHISKVLKNVDKYKLYEIDEIKITKAEMNTIENIHSDILKDFRIQRLAFVLLCFAKWELAKGKKEPWVNIKLNRIFKAANINGLTSFKQDLCVHELYLQGLVELSEIVENTSLKILFADIDREPVITLSDINESGNVFREYCGAKYVKCGRCGKMLPKTNNRLRYCSDCAKMIDREKARLRMAEKRKNA